MGSRASEILIVDDDPQIRKLFTLVLSRGGYSVTAVDTSSAAFHVLQNQTVDLIVLDLAMPEPDGFEMLKQLRRRKAELKILVVSGVMQGPLLKASEIVGADASLSKLDAPTELLPTVQAVLR